MGCSDAYAWFGLGAVRLRHFQTRYFEDFIWQNLFARSLPPADRERVLGCDHLVCPAPWRFMHLAGLERRWLMRRAAYACGTPRGIFLCGSRGCAGHL